MNLKFNTYKIIFFTVCLFFPTILVAQNIGISFNGFVKTDVIYDTRQNLSLREGHFLLWPLAERLDNNGDDINNKYNFNILSIQTRLQSNITGPEVFSAKTSAYVEAEFFGSADASINSLRLRHAYVDIDWISTKIRAGQFWHPFFNTDCFPGTVSFNTGVPFQPFGRYPQLRIVQKIADVSLTAAAITQRDFASFGPEGNSSIYLRNTGIPELFLGLQYTNPAFLIGAGAEYKMLTPRLFTAGTEGKTYKTAEKVASIAANAYTKISTGDFTAKLYGVYGQNLVDLLLPSGYVVKEFDPVTGAETYSPLNNLSVWTDLAYGKKIEAGVYAAYGKSLGTDENTMTNTVYGRGTDIKSLIRVSPRLVFNEGKFRTALEVEYTAAEFGKMNNNDKNLIDETTKVNNLRILLAFYMFF